MKQLHYCRSTCLCNVFSEDSPFSGTRFCLLSFLVSFTAGLSQDVPAKLPTPSHLMLPKANQQVYIPSNHQTKLSSFTSIPQPKGNSCSLPQILPTPIKHHIPSSTPLTHHVYPRQANLRVRSLSRSGVLVSLGSVPALERRTRMRNDGKARTAGICLRAVLVPCPCSRIWRLAVTAWMGAVVRLE